MTTEAKTARPAEGWESGSNRPKHNTSCPICGYPIAPWSVYDGSAWCCSCGRFVALPEREMQAVAP